MGSDTGGSIRNPAAYSGIVGLKPTYGLVSRRGVLTLSWTLDHAGPMARTVADVAILLQAVAGHDPADPASADAPIPEYLPALTGSAQGIRIGVPKSDLERAEGIEPDVLRAFYEAVDVLGRLGADVTGRGAARHRPGQDRAAHHHALRGGRIPRALAPRSPP